MNRFDGQRFIKYFHDPNNNNSIKHNNVRSLATDNQGKLWIGSVKGVQTFDPDNESFTNVKNSGPYPEVSDICVSSSGNIWVATYNKGLNQVRHQEGKYDLENLTSINKTIGNLINCIYEKPSQPGYIWIGSQNGLFCLNEKSRELVHPFDNNNPLVQALQNTIVNDIVEDKNNNTWIATNAKGLVKINAQSQQITYFQHNPEDPNSILSNLTSRVIIDRNGNLWISMYGSGVTQMLPDSPGKFNHLKYSELDAHGIVSDNMVSLFEDRNGIFWMGSKGKGISYFNPSTYFIQHLKHSNYISNTISGNNITSILGTSPDEIWVGTRGQGLNKIIFESGTSNVLEIKTVGNKKGIINVSSLTRFGDQLIVGQLGLECKVINLKTEKVSNFLNKTDDLIHIRSKTVLCAFPHSSDLYIGTYKGLYFYDSQKQELFDHALQYPRLSALSEMEITGIVRNKENLWITTRNNGLFKYSYASDTLINYLANSTSNKKLTSNGLLCLFQDHEENLWLGSWGGGMMKINLEKDSIDYYTTKNGMASDDVYAIFEDEENYIWLSTNHGISRLDVEHDKFKHFTTNDGLQAEEFNSRVGYFEPQYNRLYFGGINGFNVLKSENIIEEKAISKPYVSTLNIISTRNGQNIESSFSGLKNKNKSTLSHRDHTLQIQVSTLHFSDGNPLTYAYKLWPTNNEWIELKETNVITLIDLRPGQYRLLSKVKTSSGNWSEETTLLEFHKKPPWYKSMVAYLFYILISSSILFLLYQIRVNQLLKFQNLRTKISADLHDDVGSLMSGLAMQSEVVAERLEGEQKQRVDEIGQMGRIAIEKMRDIVWSLDASKDKYENLIDRMKMHLESTIPNTKFSYKLDIQVMDKSKILSPLVRQNLYLIFKEAVHNVLKHSNGDQLKVTLSKTRGNLTLSIHDNGKFVQNSEKDGMGLRSMNRRASKIEGQFEIDTNDGTNIKVSI